MYKNNSGLETMLEKVSFLISAKIKNFESITKEEWQKKVWKITTELVNCFENNRKVLICGNGGSAAQAQHFAAELVVRMAKWRKALPAIALTTDTSIITAYSNDDSFSGIFARQVEALGNENDILICLSTSGNSENVVKASQIAKEKNMKIISFVGPKVCKLDELSTISFHSSGTNTGDIQECHLIAIHIICTLVEEYFLSK